MPRLSVETKKCLKSGQCTYLHPSLFKQGPDGRPIVLVAEPTGGLIQEAEHAAEICPAQAIHLEG